MLAVMLLPESASARRLFVVGSFVEAHCWLVARSPGADESQHASAYVRESAGKGLAVALGAHRLGAAVDLLVAAGVDAAGDALLALLRREGLGTDHVHRLGPHSGQGCGLVDAQGGSTVSVFAGANALLSEHELRLADPALQQAALVYAQLEAPMPVVRSALARARRVGAVTVLNPSPWPTHADWRADWAALLTMAQVLVVNRAEARSALAALEGLGRDGAPDALPDASLQAIWRQWPNGRWLIITLGEQGCVAYGSDGAALRVPGRAVTAQQPIGVGDAFSAGLCAALMEGLPMADALRTATVCGALAAGRDGILEALPRRDEVLSLLR